MVIVYRGGGNHSNKLFQAIHLEAFCLENNLRYFNPSFGSMAKYYGLRNSIFNPLLCHFIAICGKIGLINITDFSVPGELHSYYDTVLKKELVFAKGWHFRAFDLTRKHRDYFIRKYSLLPKYYRENELYKKLKDLDRNRHIVVGVHVRRGDYKVWEEGKYYFSDAVYRKYMESLSSQLTKNPQKRILFIIFSDEQINIAEDESVIPSKNAWYVDQMLMSMCDYLIGPPSTFTMWASYTGHVKLYLIKDDSGAVDLNEFKYHDG
jgi:hypothetical protein